MVSMRSLEDKAVGFEYQKTHFLAFLENGELTFSSSQP